MDRKELIERLEKAEGPDRELDAEIAFLAGWRVQSRGLMNINGSTETVTAWFGPGDDMEEHWREYARLFRHNLLDKTKQPPRFTSDIGAALTLVPEVHKGDWLIAPGAAYIAPDYMYPAEENQGSGYHKSTAIALCIAALKAQSLHSSEQKKGERK